MKTLQRIMALAAMAVAAIASAPQSSACTRVIYEGSDSLIIIGRSLDWKTPIPTNVYVYPRGMFKMGDKEKNSVHWTSRYGAVYAVGYDGGVTEGMNEKGLSVNGLFCKGTIYQNHQTSGRRPISLAMFPAWILDMCATTQEAIDLLQKQDFSLGGATFDNGTATALHWGITDRQGHTVVVEFTDGVIHIYPADSSRCMTNDPNWPQMQAIVKYWEGVGGTNMLPGTVKSPDRCVRGQFFATHVTKTGDADLGASITRTVLFNCCVPYSYTVETEPNVSSTQWRSFSNLRDLRYYFDMATANGFYYIDLNRCDLRPGASVMKITTTDMTNACGDQTGALRPVPPFTPMF